MTGALPSVGIVTGSISRNAGGLFNSVRKSAIHLLQAGAGVSVYGLEDEHSAADTGEWMPVEPQVLPAKQIGPLRYAYGLSGKLATADHDVVHLHGIWELQSRAVNRWKRQSGGKVMISPRGMLDPWALRNSRWKKWLVGAWYENRNLREADCLHALSLSEAGAMREYGLINPIALIPNATDLPDIPPRTASARRKTLLFLGRIHPKKGLNELIKAWALAGELNPEFTREWELAIAGWDDGGHIAPLTQQIDRLGLRNSVELIGPVYGEAKDRLLRRVDAFILPSHSEGLPMSVLEAWAYRLPVLMTDECNLPEGFEAKAAIRIETDPAKQALVLLESLGAPDLRQLGNAGRELVEQRFSWTEVARQHLEVYQWLIGERSQPAFVTTV